MSFQAYLDALETKTGKAPRVGPEKLRQYPGLKEEYYLADFEPDAGVLDELSVDRGRILVVVRPPPDVSIYHRKANRLFPRVCYPLQCVRLRVHPLRNLKGRQCAFRWCQSPCGWLRKRRSR